MVFSDESRHTAGRYRSIGAISLPAEEVDEASCHLSELLERSNVPEFKWHDLRSAKHRFCAIKLVDFTFDRLLPLGVRVDVLTWDTQDSRHSIHGRDDILNYERMFFHLHKNLMSRREGDSNWELRPDERVEIDWSTIQACLGNVGKWRRHFDLPLLSESFSECLFNVKSLKQVVSRETPLSQVADLFAGMSPYSRERANTIMRVQQERTGQKLLFLENSEEMPSKADYERFEVISHLHSKCARMRYGVSFRSYGYLKTWNPRKPVNFWHYKPQRTDDKAPIKSG